jgi:predicted Ser/Thr protein kinase
MLPSHLKNYGVVPGNHRIRLFESSLKKIIVLLKNNESAKFIKNDIDSRFNNSLSYTPKVLSFGSDWLIEEFIKGVPFNRVKNNKSNKALEILMSLHNKELINKNKKNIPIDKYLNECKKELYSLVEIIEENNPIKKEIIFGLENLLFNILSLNINELETSITHGDFQEGNIRINSNNELFVLDWESADNRFYLYDAFVMLSAVRTGIELEKAFELFFKKANKYQIKIDRYSKTTLIFLLCFEELRFHFHEDISSNFFSPGVNSKKTLKKISTFLDLVKIK